MKKPSTFGRSPAAALRLVPLVLTLSACLPCKHDGPPVLGGTPDPRYTTIRRAGYSRTIRLSPEEAEALASLFSNCHSCTERNDTDLIDLLHSRYILEFHRGPLPKLTDPFVGFSAFRNPPGIRCLPYGTKAEIRRILAPHMDELDRHAQEAERLRKPLF